MEKDLGKHGAMGFLKQHVLILYSPPLAGDLEQLSKEGTRGSPHRWVSMHSWYAPQGVGMGVSPPLPLPVAPVHATMPKHIFTPTWQIGVKLRTRNWLSVVLSLYPCFIGHCPPLVCKAHLFLDIVCSAEFHIARPRFNRGCRPNYCAYLPGWGRGKGARRQAS